MKEKLINNLGIKILSICLAVFLWVVIVNVEDPVKTREFTNVPVQVLNESTLTSKDKAYNIESGNTVDFTVSGKRSDLEKLKKTDFIATADLSQLTPPFDTVKINVECVRNPDVEIIMGKISTMTISLENIIRKSFSINVVPTGNCAPGYAIGKAEVSPVMIEVSGAESVINKVSDIKVAVNINGAKSEVTKVVTPKAYNKDGVEIDPSKIAFNYRQVSATVTILRTKTIPVSIKTVGEVADGYQFVEAAYEPQEIEVKGDNEALDKITSLPIPIDIEGLTEDNEYTISIHDILLDYNVALVDDELENLVIKVTIEKLVEKTISISRDDIMVKNLPDNLSTEFTDPNTVYSVTITGLMNELSKVSEESLKPTIDLAGIGKGNHKVLLELTCPDSVKVLSAVKVGIKLVPAHEEVDPDPSSRPENGTQVDHPESSPGTEPSVQPTETGKPLPEAPEEDEEEKDKTEE